nr:ead/Ea22-like family protein [Klebsiella pneumoniae]
PANGSKDHLRKLALLLVKALEKARRDGSYWKTQCRGITDHCEELQARIAELESTIEAAG